MADRHKKNTADVRKEIKELVGLKLVPLHTSFQMLTIKSGSLAMTRIPRDSIGLSIWRREDAGNLEEMSKK